MITDFRLSAILIKLVAIVINTNTIATIYSQAIMNHQSSLSNNSQCSTDEINSLSLIWRECTCEKSENNFLINIKCLRRSWITIPIAEDLNIKRNNSKMIELSITGSELAYLSQDSLKSENIQKLDLSRNNIEAINVNAFRGLEDKLHELILNHNHLSTVPSWPLTYLRQLRILSLRNNLIKELKGDLFDETQLYNLNYLHLDNNKIGSIASRSLIRLPLQVFTASNNKINEIEKVALPASIWFIDLTNNILPQVPYLAIRELKFLKVLDLEGNNITDIEYNPEVELTNEIDLILSNNRVKVIQDDAFNSFKRFNKLDLSYNQIRSISSNSFRTISQMRKLDLSNNRLVHMPTNLLLNLAKSLKRLNLEENEFHQLPAALHPLRSLEYLNLNSNKLTRLEKAKMENMKNTLNQLYLSSNRLTDIPTDILEGMIRLYHLDLSKNRIRSMEKLSFGKFNKEGTNLLRLNLAGNFIEKIDDSATFLYMNSLSYLDLSYNKIKNISADAFIRLNSLDTLLLQNNLMEEYPKDGLNHLQKLKNLILDSNPIQFLPDNAFEYIDNLQRISLSRTKIYAINERIFHHESAKNLISINLSNAHIRHIASRAFSNLYHLQQIILRDNQLTTINSNAFSSLPQLRQLNLASNQISKLMQNCIIDVPKLQYLSLSRNQLKYLAQSSFKNLNSLQHIDMSYNKLDYFNLEFLKQNIIVLKTIDLSHNNIRMIDLSEAKRTLINVNVAYNRLESITKIQMESFEKLEILLLNNNNIIEIQSNSLQSSPNLRYLSLQHNHLRVLRRETFFHQKLYKYLNLANNAINEIDENTFGYNNVHQLDLSFNEFNSVPVKGLQSIQKSIMSLSLTVCFRFELFLIEETKKNFQGNRIKSLSADDFVKLDNLTELILADNMIEVIEEAAFALLPKLLRLDISNNPIITWNPHAFKDLGNSIAILNLANTGLFSIPKVTSKGLHNLNISANKIRDISISDIENQKKLKIFDISYNNVRKVDPKLLEYLSEIEIFNFSGNPIDKLIDRHLENLHTVKVLTMKDMTRLTRLPTSSAFRFLRNLKEFHLDNLPLINIMNISEILYNLPPLRELSVEIKDNRLNKQLSNADMRFLRAITITGKNLKTIDNNAFAELRGYKLNITIKNTLIEHFPSSIFNTMSSISFLSLNLMRNRIRSIQPFPYTKPPLLNQHGTILYDIELKDNPIICDCRLIWLTKWIEYFRHGEYQKNHLNDTLCENRSTLLETYSNDSQHQCFQTNHASSIIFHNRNAFHMLTYSFVIIYFQIIFLFTESIFHSSI